MRVTTIVLSAPGAEAPGLALLFQQVAPDLLKAPGFAGAQWLYDEAALEVLAITQWASAEDEAAGRHVAEKSVEALAPHGARLAAMRVYRAWAEL